MKAIAQDRYGPADVLELLDIDVPVVDEHEVLVRVQAAGCGPDVWHYMTGRPYFARLMLGLRRPKVAVRGDDVAGTVESVGRSVTRFKPGDEVMGFAAGSFAELTAVPEQNLVHKPAQLSFDKAAAVPVSGVTALQALRDVGRMAPGQRVLIIGAAGGVGTLAVQMAKALGGHVSGVCSTSKMEHVWSIGADDVIDYTSEEFTDCSQHWDLIIDTAGRRSLSHLRRALGPQGTLVIVGGDGGGRWTGGFFRGILRAPLLSLFVGQRLRALVSKESGEDLRTVSEMIEEGSVTPVIDRTYQLVEAAAAIRYLEQGHPRGKVVIVI